MHHVSVAGVVCRENNEVLLIKRRDNGQWQIPGGILESQEFILDGLRREILEETGIQVEPIRLTGVYKNLTLQAIALVFLCREPKGKLRSVTNETTQIGWYNCNKALEMCISTFSIRIEDALAGIEVPFIRNHDGIRILD